MKIKIIVSFICIIILFCAGYYFYQYKMNNFYSHIPSEYKTSVENAIKTSGNDRNIKIALLLVNGNDLNAMCDMVSKMSPIDLCNLTPLKLVNHVKTTFKTNKNVPWAVKEDSLLFKDYILPNKIDAEALFLDRNKLKKVVYPVVKDCKTPAEVVSTIMNKFVIVNENKLGYGSTYPYDYTPLDSKKYGITPGAMSCRAKALFWIAALRSVGIPAVKSECATYLDQYGTHSSVVYYDINENKWKPTEIEYAGPVTDKKIIRERYVSVTKILSNPPYPKEAYFSKRTLYKLIDIENENQYYGKIDVITKGNNKKPVYIGIYVWFENLNCWYPTKKIKTDATGKTSFLIGPTISSNKKYNPYLIIVGVDDRIVCKKLEVAEYGKYKLEFDLNKANQPLSVSL